MKLILKYSMILLVQVSGGQPLK